MEEHTSSLKRKHTIAVTIAQDEESSVVHGMPGEAIKLEAATYVLSPNSISEALLSLVSKRLNDAGRGK